MSAIARLKGIPRFIRLVLNPIGELTCRDIARRPEDRVRGNKKLWSAVSSVNAAGAAAYWVVGRR